MTAAPDSAAQDSVEQDSLVPDFALQDSAVADFAVRDFAAQESSVPDSLAPALVAVKQESGMETPPEPQSVLAEGVAAMARVLVAQQIEVLSELGRPVRISPAVQELASD